MSEELVSPTGLNYSPVETSGPAASAMQTAWDLDMGGSYHGSFSNENGQTSGSVNAEGHVHGDAWGHEYQGELDGGAAASYGPNGVHATEHVGGHAEVHSGGFDTSSHSAHTAVDSGSHSGDHGGSHGDHGGSHGDHGGSHDGGM